LSNRHGGRRGCRRTAPSATQRLIVDLETGFRGGLSLRHLGGALPSWDVVNLLDRLRVVGFARDDGAGLRLARGEADGRKSS